MRAVLGGVVGLAASIALPATFSGLQFLVVLWVVAAVGSITLIVIGFRDWRQNSRRSRAPDTPSYSPEMERAKAEFVRSLQQADEGRLQQANERRDRVLTVLREGPSLAAERKLGIRDLIIQGRNLIAMNVTSHDVNAWLEAVRTYVTRPLSDTPDLDFRDLAYRVHKDLPEHAEGDELDAAVNHTMAPLKIINRRLGGEP